MKSHRALSTAKNGGFLVENRPLKRGAGESFKKIGSHDSKVKEIEYEYLRIVLVV